MTLKEIKKALSEGRKVCWSHEGYEVIDGGKAGLLINCTANGFAIGLTHSDGVTLNVKPEEFFIKETEKDDAEYRAEAGPAVSEFYGVPESPRRAKCAKAGRAVRALQWENAKREVHELREALSGLLSVVEAEPEACAIYKAHADKARAALDNCKELI